MDQSFLIEKLLNIVQELNEISGIPEDERLQNKNILNDADPNKRLRPRLNNTERVRTIEIATLFAKTFYEFKKKKTPDDKPDTLIKDIRKKATPPPLPDKNEPGKKKMGWGGLMLAGLVALIGGAAALIYGLMQGGPLMGIMKILSKIGIQGGLKMIMKGVGGFVKVLTNILKWPLKIFGTISKAFGGMFKGFAKAVLPGGMKAVGKTLLGSVGKFLGHFAKAFRRIPIIGSLISIGFAIKRFKDGDVTQGVIDTLSALSGLLYLTPLAPLAFPIALGLDVLNAIIDVKKGQAAKRGENKSGGDILLEMRNDLTAKMMPFLRVAPVIGTIYEFGDAYQAFKGGNIMQGLKHIGMGILKLTPLPMFASGIGLLMSMFGSKEDEEPRIKSDSSWIDKIKNWIKDKILNLPYVLRKPLEWFGFIESDSNDSLGSAVSQNFSSYKDKVSEFTDGVWGSVRNFGESFTENLKRTGEIAEDRFRGYVEGAKNIGNNMRSVVADQSKKIGDFIGRGWGSMMNRTKEVQETSISNINRRLDSVPRIDVAMKPISDGTKKLANVAKIHLEYMASLVRYNQAIHKTLEQIHRSGGMGNNAARMQVSIPQMAQNVEAFGYDDNRKGYSSSHYAFA